ncbi:MAG: GNAT family N-acetyltransferase [Candidatus Nanopelagicaceae bacterium]|nr:GNAT family N-acetyltransferase [Candidatus Nanopelagicaceae bacterium]
MSTMGAEFAIREAKFDDAPAIARVSYLTWLHAYRGILPDRELDALNVESVTDKWVQILSLAIPKSGTFVAINKKSIIAYSRFYPSVDSDDDPSKVATIGSIYVHPDFQHQGVAHELMVEILKVTKSYGFTELTLHVLTANERARKFYESLSWEQDVDAVIEKSDGETVPKVRYRRSLL